LALEAAASGVPCIASDLPGVRSVVKNDQTGLLVKPEDTNGLREAIKKLLNDAETRKKMGVAARRLEEVYGGLVGGVTNHEL